MTVTVGGVRITSQPTVQVTPGSVSGSQSAVSFASSTDPEGTTDAVTILVKDAAGNEMRRPLVNRFMRASRERYDGAYPGAYPLVGSPDDIVADMVQMSELGLAGTSVAFLDYLKEIPYFVQEVLPRLECLGLRQAA